jgi:hypothetical protein
MKSKRSRLQKIRWFIAKTDHSKILATIIPAARQATSCMDDIARITQFSYHPHRENNQTETLPDYPGHFK